MNLGRDLITNGKFTTDLTGWTADTDWVQDSNAAVNLVAATPAASELGQDFNSVIGKRYELRYDILAGTDLSGTFSISATSAFAALELEITVGIDKVYVITTVDAASAQDLTFLVGDDNSENELIYLDNIELREILEDGIYENGIYRDNLFSTTF